MAICIPSLEDARPRSDAEAAVLVAIHRDLGSDFTVLHSVAWLSRPGNSGPYDGETDFLIAHPRLGLLVIEVKGGRVSLDYRRNRWSSVDRRGVEHDINNPFEQAKRSKFGILEKLKEHPAWQRLGIRRINIGHSAFFPDIGDGLKLKGPDAPEEIIGDRGNLGAISDWTRRCLAYWAGSAGGFDEIGVRGVELVVSIFARAVTTRPLLSARLQDEEKERIRLTERQIQILDLLQRQRRVMIAGGAGTGKTLIAREKAVRLASEEMRTLLVCFNRGLADHLREQCTAVGYLDVASFHQVCHQWCRRAKVEAGRDVIAEARRDYPGADEFNQLMPLALANAVDALGPFYDAIVVDEAQDFGDEFWLPIEMLLTRLEHGLLYVFLDENQDIYRRSANIPVSGEPMVLDRNCRNTGAIHRGAYRHYRGMPVAPSEIEGVAVETLLSNGIDKQARAIIGLVTRLLVDEDILAHQIAVLICDGRRKDEFERAIVSLPLPKIARLGRLEDFGPGVLTIDTVARFKGLERDVIILCGFDGCSPDRDRETLYVGMSRAKSALYLCGTAEACARMFGPP